MGALVCLSVLVRKLGSLTVILEKVCSLTLDSDFSYNPDWFQPSC